MIAHPAMPLAPDTADVPDEALAEGTAEAPAAPGVSIWGESVPATLLYRFTRKQIDAMVEHGIFAADDRFELLEGLVITKMPKKRAHTFATQILRDLLFAMLAEGYFVNDQEPVSIGTSEPEPDIAVIRGKRSDTYPGEHPTANLVVLIAEVSDSTLAADRQHKRTLYAAAGIPVYWIVNLVEKQIEVYTAPLTPPDAPALYTRIAIYQGEQPIPVVIDGVEVGTIRPIDVISA